MKRLTLLLLVLLPACLHAELERSATPPGRPGRSEVLVIYSDDRPLPSTEQFDTGFQRQLTAIVGDEVDLYTEYLGMNRFSGPEQEREFAEHLGKRYRDRSPHVIVATGIQSLQFVRAWRGQFLPDVPVVFGGVRVSAYQPVPDQLEYGVTMELATRPTLDLMLSLHPDLQEVVVVSGASFIDGRIEAAARSELADAAGPVRLRYWSGLPLPDLINRARALPPGTAIYFLSFITDGRGVNYTSNQITRQLGNTTKVPIYGFSSTYVGRGAIGGLGEQFESHGQEVGRLVGNLLQGRAPVRAGAVPGPGPIFQFDAQELARWHIDHRRLPPGSQIINDELDANDELHLRFIFALTAILLLAALVVILLVNRQRLRRAETQLQERLRFEQLTSTLSAALINTPPGRMDAEVESALEKVRRALRLDRCILFDFNAEMKFKRITHRAEAPASAPLAGTMNVTQLPWFFRELQAGRVVALVRAERDLPADATLERAYCAQQKIVSVLIMPIRQGGHLVRWIGFYTGGREQPWPAELTGRLHMLGEIFVSALAGAQAELALQHSEQLNRDILSSLHEQVALVDRTGAILSVNQAWYRFLRECGRPDQPVLGANYLEACRRSAEQGGGDAARVLAGLESVLTGARRSFDMVYAFPIPGSPVVRWFRLAITPVTSQMGGAVVMHADVTEQQRLHEALLQSEERYREVVESQTELVCRYRGDAVLTFVNEAYCRFFGRTRESLLGHSFLELIPEVVHAQVREQIATLYRERRPSTYEHEVTLPDGSVRWQQWVDYPILDERGEIEEFQAIGRDITDRKRAEEATRNLAHAARLAVAGELTASIAHEINQPLGAILSNADAAEMLLERPHPPLDEIRQILIDIRRDDERASDIIRHLRSLLRKHELDLREIDVNEMVAEVLRLAAADGQRRRVRFVREFATTLPPIRGDRVHLQQVLLNLLLNAMDAMAETAIPQRRVTIRTRALPNAVEIEIADTGHGIPPDRLGSIFDSFYTTKKEGMGLGLSIARSIIEAHRGTIAAKNHPEGGATFAITLPAA